MRLGITSTIYTSIASVKMIKACFVDSWGPLSQDYSTKVLVVTTSWCSNEWTVRTNASVNGGGFRLQGAINWSRSSQCTPAVQYIVSLVPSTLVWIHSHPKECCMLFLLLPVLRTIFKCASRVISAAAALAASWWTHWCPRCCGVWLGGALDAAPVIRLDSDPLAPCRGVCGVMICWSRKGEEDDDEKKWEVPKNILAASSQNQISDSQLAQSTGNETCYI